MAFLEEKKDTTAISSYSQLIPIGWWPSWMSHMLCSLLSPVLSLFSSPSFISIAGRLWTLPYEGLVLPPNFQLLLLFFWPFSFFPHSESVLCLHHCCCFWLLCSNRNKSREWNSGYHQRGWGHEKGWRACTKESGQPILCLNTADACQAPFIYHSKFLLVPICVGHHCLQGSLECSNVIELKGLSPWSSSSLSHHLQALPKELP